MWPLRPHQMLTFKKLYFHHLSNLSYAEDYGERRRFPTENILMAIIDACMVNRDLILKIQSYWFYTEKMATKLVEYYLFWSDGFRAAYMRWNPMLAPLKCRTPFNFAKLMTDRKMNVIPDGIIPKNHTDNEDS